MTERWTIGAEPPPADPTDIGIARKARAASEEADGLRAENARLVEMLDAIRSNSTSTDIKRTMGVAVMANVFDVAKYILEKTGPIAPTKLQKLVYYSQAWHLVWEGKPLFPERIEAWANGPVVPDLFGWHRGQWSVSAAEMKSGDSSRIKNGKKKTIDSVLKFYGEKSAQWLSDLTHREAPWLDAREGLALGERGNKEIAPAAMQWFYSQIRR